MKSILIIFLLFGIAAVFVCDTSAQQNPSGVECPATNVLTSAEVVTDGEHVTFHSELTGGNVDRSILKYYWTIDRGRIVNGQGTPVLIVDTAGQGAAGSITATIQIAPYNECCWVASQTTRVHRKGALTKTDKFWEWFWLNSQRIRNRNSPYYQPSGPDAFEELKERLREVDAGLMFHIPSSKEYQSNEQLIIGWSGKVFDTKKVDAFIARAPIMIGWTISSAKPVR